MVSAHNLLKPAGQMGERFLVITELFLPTKGGTAVWFDEVYRHLGGQDTHIVTADVPGAAAHDRGHPNTVHRLTLSRHRWLRPESLGIYTKLFTAALVIGLRHKFDAVHAGRVLPEGLVGLNVARVVRRPLIIYAHGEELTTWRQPQKLRAMQSTFTHANLIIANSDFTRLELKRLGVSEEKIAILSPGVNVERFRPLLPCADLRALIGITSCQKLIVSVGRLSRRKGFDQVIRALPGLVKRGIDVHYAIIGIGEDLGHLEALSREAGVVQRVKFLGPVSADELPRWYNAADVVTMPNREIDGDTEGFGMVLIEAAACGKPTLAGMAGGTGAAIVDHVTGLRVDGADLEAVGNGLALLLQDEALARSFGENGHNRAVTEFSWERVAERTRELHTRDALRA